MGSQGRGQGRSSVIHGLCGRKSFANMVLIQTSRMAAGNLPLIGQKKGRQQCWRSCSVRHQELAVRFTLGRELPSSKFWAIDEQPAKIHVGYPYKIRLLFACALPCQTLSRNG